MPKIAKRVEMGERPPYQRIKDFNQVTLGYTPEQAQQEAKRCLQCKNPVCISGCPVGINIKGFVKAIADGDFALAAKILYEKNNLPAICGRVCPQEEQCELMCVLKKVGEPLAIGDLERFAADWKMFHQPEDNEPPPVKTNFRVAVVGSGPAGLTCAGDLARMGVQVTIFESLNEAGGVLRYGIPEFRLPGNILDYELRRLKNLGVEFKLNFLVGRTKTIADLFADGFQAVFLGTGAGLPKFLNIPGENFNHIYSANEFLVRVNLMHAYEFPEKSDTPIYIGRKVAVIGGGNTAMDAARTALRLGAEEVTLIYRRSEAEMPARQVEIMHAREEGIKFLLLTNPVEFLGNEKGFVRAIECVKMELTEKDESGRRAVRAIPNSNFIVPVDMVIVAIGLSPNPVVPSLTPGLKTDAEGHLIVDENRQTSIPGVFAGGDITGGETVIQAMGMGKLAAEKIYQYLKNKQT